MLTGKVKWFSPAKGFGFITPDEGTDDVFLHLSKVEEANLPTLESGTALQYSNRSFYCYLRRRLPGEGRVDGYLAIR